MKPAECFSADSWHDLCKDMQGEMIKSDMGGVQMSFFRREDLKELSERGDAPAVSVYLPPSKDEPSQRLIRLKNALSDAEVKLSVRGIGESQKMALLAPLRQLMDHSSFWSDRNGLAVFISPATNQVYRVPITFPELVVVGERFHLGPLMPLLSGDGRFIILSLSQKSVRLFEASQFSIRELDNEDIPTSLTDAVGYDLKQQSLQFHSGSPTRGNGLKRDAIYHGHGGGVDDADGELEKFLHLVDNGIAKMFSGSTSPLVVAAVGNLLATYRQLSKHPNLLEDGILGSPEDCPIEDLHKKAWAIVAPYFRRDQDTAKVRFHESLGTPLTSAELEVIVPATCNARVDTLFICANHQVWGRYDYKNEKLEVRDGDAKPDDEGLLDLAAIQCLLNGGTVYAVDPDEMPVSGPIAAIFRYDRKHPSS